MNKSIKNLSLCAFLGAATQANAVVLKDFTGFGDATGVYGSFAKTPGSDGITYTAVNGDGGSWITHPNVVIQNTDQLQITLKLGLTNTDDKFRILLLDADGPSNAEAYLYTIPTSAFNTSTFTTYTFPGDLSAWSLFNPSTFGKGNGDGIQNFGAAPDTGLFEFQLQGDFEAGGQVLDIIVQNVSVVPEPTSAGLTGIGALMLLLRRRRRA